MSFDEILDFTALFEKNNYINKNKEREEVNGIERGITKQRNDTTAVT